MVKHLSLIAHTFYATEFDFPKALRKEEIVGSIENDEIQLVDDYVEFIKNYQGDTLVITGSLYFISEVKSN